MSARGAMLSSWTDAVPIRGGVGERSAVGAKPRRAPQHADPLLLSEVRLGSRLPSYDLEVADHIFCQMLG